MKVFKKIFCFVLVFILFISSIIIAKADNNKFVSVVFGTYSEKNDIVETTETLFTDGKFLYASTELLEQYTAYYYDKSNNAFVRTGQEYGLSLSSTTIDYANHKVTVKMMNSKKVYDLHNVFQFGSSYYLPLDQMATFLKAKIKIKDNKIMILNSGYSIADAAYNLNEYKYILGYTDIVDNIFAGNEKLYNNYCVLSYFSSTIFDLRVKNLDFFTHSGDVEYYEDALSACVTDNDEYLKTQQSENSFLERLKYSSELVEELISINKKLKNCTTVIKDAYETFSDTEDISNLDIQYIEAKDWNTVFGTLSKCYSYMDYFVKALAMTQDHKSMINDCYDEAKTSNKQFYIALANTNQKYGQDFFDGIIQKISETLINELPENAIKKYASNAVPYIAVIKGVKAFFKLMGIDLADNLQYSIMIDSTTASELTDIYSDLMLNAGQNKETSEKFRSAGIFMLLSMKHAYESGNKLSKKTEGSDSLFNDKIDDICSRLNLFYRAIESSNYDSIGCVDELLKINQNALDISSILSNAQEISNPAPTSNYWESFAKDLIYNLPANADAGKIMCSDYLSFELIDMNNDKAPEILMYSISAGGGGMSCTAYAYFDTDKYVVKYLESGEHSPCNYIYPYEDSESGTICYISGMLDSDYCDESLEEGYYSAGFYWRNLWYQNIWSFTNNNLILKASSSINDVDGFEELYNPGGSSKEEQQNALENIRKYNDDLHNRFKSIDTKYCFESLQVNGVICDSFSLTSYHDVMNENSANSIIKAYLSGKHEIE